MSKKQFKVKEEKYPPNVLINKKYLERIDEDIERCYPLLRRSDFLNNLLQSYYNGVAGWKKIDKKMSIEKKDKETPDKKLRQSFK